jgi:hypothetical protein
LVAALASIRPASLTVIVAPPDPEVAASRTPPPPAPTLPLPPAPEVVPDPEVESPPDPVGSIDPDPAEPWSTAAPDPVPSPAPQAPRKTVSERAYFSAQSSKDFKIVALPYQLNARWARLDREAPPISVIDPPRSSH